MDDWLLVLSISNIVSGLGKAIRELKGSSLTIGFESAKEGVADMCTNVQI
jgi:hypothetical protein